QRRPWRCDVLLLLGSVVLCCRPLQVSAQMTDRVTTAAAAGIQPGQQHNAATCIQTQCLQCKGSQLLLRGCMLYWSATGCGGTVRVLGA
ncbi:hypothetical protein COO60DRAFT_1502115, partial [Scenedesmus sp. NREL 46B-D3]